MRASILPLSARPAFWGLDRDFGNFKDVLDTMENFRSSAENSRYEFKETEKAFLFTLEIPGLDKDKLEVNVEDQVLKLEGVKRNLFADEDAEEIKVSKSISIPKDTDKEKIQAHYEDGIFYVAFPKQESAQPRKINVTSGTRSEDWSNLLDK